jgi:hypothetical protein
MSGSGLIDNSIAKSVSSLQGLNDIEKSIITDHILDSAYNDRLSEHDVSIKSGPALWEHLHWMGKMADDMSMPSIYHTALSLLTLAHPCMKCRSHIPETLKQVPVSKYTSFFRHSIDMHNHVNRRLGKEVFTYLDASIYYGVDCDSCGFSASSNARSVHQT